MPLNEFGNSSSSYVNGKKNVTSLFVQKPYLRSKCIEANTEEDIDLKNQKTIYEILLTLEKQLPKTMLIKIITILV